MIPLHPIQKPQPEQSASFPDDNFCFLAGANGLYKQVRNAFYSARVKSAGVAGLAELTEEARLNVPPLPLNLFRRIESFLVAVFNTFKSEGVVLLLCNPLLREWRVMVPRQTVRGLHVTYTFGTLPPVPDGFEFFGTIHSHANIGAFHSGTDDHDEASFDGLHITVGNLDKPSRSYACRWMLAGRAFTRSLEDVVAAESLPTVDVEWLAQVVPADPKDVSTCTRAVETPTSERDMYGYDDLPAWSDFYGQEFESREELRDYLVCMREEITEQLAEFELTP